MTEQTRVGLAWQRSIYDQQLIQQKPGVIRGLTNDISRAMELGDYKSYTGVEYISHLSYVWDQAALDPVTGQLEGGQSSWMDIRFTHAIRNILGPMLNYYEVEVNEIPDIAQQGTFQSKYWIEEYPKGYQVSVSRSFDTVLGEAGSLSMTTYDLMDLKNTLQQVLEFAKESDKS